MNRDPYAAIAGLYDPVTAAFLDPVRRLVRETLADCGARRVLDVCCGTGRLTLALRRAGFAAVGLDASPAMLAKARAAAGPGQAVFARMDARRPAFPDASFDAAVAAFCLHENGPHDRRSILEAMFRLVRPGGQVLVVDYLAGLPPSPMGLLVTLAERLAGGDHYRNYRDFLARKGVVGLFQAAGRPVDRRLACLGGRAALVAATVATPGPAGPWAVREPAARP